MDGDNLLKIILAAITAVALGVCLWVGVNAFENHIENSKNFNLHETVNIKSLETYKAMSGCFLMGSGTVNEEAKYYIYVYTEDDGYKLKEFDADATTIYETITEDGQPYAEIYINETETDYRYKLYVPEGTIVTQYDAMITE